MFTTDCSKEERMCSLMDAVSLRCLDLSIRNRNMKTKVRYECITNGYLAHWPPSAFAQFGLFTTTMGRLTHCMAIEHIR